MNSKLLAVSTRCGLLHNEQQLVGVTGVEFLQFGPAGFILDLHNKQWKSRWMDFVWNNKQDIAIKDGIQWLQTYITYLQFLASLLPKA